MTKLDEMLSKWPMPERPQLEADEAAERVLGAIADGQLPASVDETLLAPPLPKTSDEGHRGEAAEQVKTSAPQTDRPGSAAPVIARVESKMSKDRTRDRTSFQELAKMATTPPPPTSQVPPSASASGPAAVVRGKEADASDSGIVDLKMIATADPSGAQRAQTTPLAAEGLFEDEAAPKAAPAAQPAPSAPAAAPAVAQTAPVASAKAAVAPKKAEENKGGGGVVVVLGTLLAAGGIAAGVFFYVKHQHAQHAAVATTTVSAPDKATTEQAKNTAPGTTATAAASVAQNDQTPDELPEVDQNGKPKPRLSFHAHPKSATGATAASAEPAPTASAAVDPKLVANIPNGNAGGNSGDLAEAMKAAAGGGTGLGSGAQQAPTGPSFVTGAVPQRPSQGQVAGAIGTVMPAARACVASGSPISHATITFQSDGSVKSVSVTGFAAGKPEEACIKGALSKAHVDPFAEATYPMTVSVRPE